MASFSYCREVGRVGREKSVRLYGTLVTQPHQGLVLSSDLLRTRSPGGWLAACRRERWRRAGWRWSLRCCRAPRVPRGPTRCAEGRRRPWSLSTWKRTPLGRRGQPGNRPRGEPSRSWPPGTPRTRRTRARTRGTGRTRGGGSGRTEAGMTSSWSPGIWETGARSLARAAPCSGCRTRRNAWGVQGRGSRGYTTRTTRGILR